MSQIQHIWTVLCVRSIVDQETQNISLVDVLEQINVPADVWDKERQLLLPDFEVVSFWGRISPKRGEHIEARLVLRDPKGQVLHQHHYEVDLREHKRTRTRAKVNGFSVQAVGQFCFEVSHRLHPQVPWTTVAQVPLLLELQP